jgi:hypothetical protein
MVFPLVSITVAVVGIGVFGVRLTLVLPFAVSVIDLGGQVWKTPALELVPAMLAEMSAAPDVAQSPDRSGRWRRCCSSSRYQR